MIGQAPGLRPSCYQICCLVPGKVFGKKANTSFWTLWESLWSNQYFISCKVVGPRHRCEKKGRYSRWSFPCLGILQDSKNYFRLGNQAFQNEISQHDHCFKVSRLEFTQNTAVEFYPKHQFGPKRSLNLLSASNPIRDRGFYTESCLS